MGDGTVSIWTGLLLALACSGDEPKDAQPAEDTAPPEEAGDSEVDDSGSADSGADGETGAPPDDTSADTGRTDTAKPEAQQHLYLGDAARRLEAGVGGLVAADWDADGDDDLLVTEMATGNYDWFFWVVADGAAEGSDHASAAYSTSHASMSEVLGVADVDGDGVDDPLFGANRSGEDEPGWLSGAEPDLGYQSFTSDGSARVVATAFGPFGAEVLSVVYSTDDGAEVLPGLGTGSTPATAWLDAGQASLDLADVDGDGLGDLGATGFDGVVAVHTSGFTGTRTASDAELLVTAGSPALEATHGDLDGDGVPDLVVLSDPGSPRVDLLGGAHTGSVDAAAVGFASAVASDATHVLHYVHVVDLDADGHDDLLLATSSTTNGVLAVHLGPLSGALLEDDAAVLVEGASSQGLAIGLAAATADLAGDGQPGLHFGTGWTLYPADSGLYSFAGGQLLP